MAVSQALKAVPGVIDAKVSYDDKRAQIEYDATVAKPQELVTAVKEAGFRARLSDDGSREPGAPGASRQPARQR